jgi:hypothetical protein
VCLHVVTNSTSRHDAIFSYLQLEHTMPRYHYVRISYPSFRAPSEHDNGYCPTYAPEACLSALHEAIWSEPVLEEDFDAWDEQSDEREPHYFACFDYTDDSTDPQKQRKYWLHWLRDLFPRVLGDLEQLVRQLGTP